MGYKINIDIPGTMDRFDPKFRKAQMFLDNEVLKDCNPYVPMRTGTLAGSGTRGTVIGDGEVVYNAIYAKDCYYALSRHFSKDKHPQACAQWFEKAKSAKCKSSWIPGVEKIIKG